MQFNYDVDSSNVQDRRGVEFVKNRINELLDIINVKTSSEAREKFLYIMKKIELETNLSKLGIDNKEIKLIINNGFNPQRMKNNPKTVSKDDLRKLLENIK